MELDSNPPPHIFITFRLAQRKFACNVVHICLSCARPKGRKLFGGVKGRNGELRSTFGQERVATNRKLKRRMQLRVSWLVVLDRER